MRKLTLRSETLAELSATELADVAAGASAACLTRQISLCYLCALTPPIFGATKDLTLVNCP